MLDHTSEMIKEVQVAYDALKDMEARCRAIRARLILQGIPLRDPDMNDAIQAIFAQTADSMNRVFNIEGWRDAVCTPALGRLESAVEHLKTRMIDIERHNVSGLPYRRSKSNY